MMIALHKNARTTPATRAEIAASTETAATLALRYGVSEGTVYKWKGRDSFHDASHTPRRLQTTLTPAQEQIVVELRKTLLLPLDDLRCRGGRYWVSFAACCFANSCIAKSVVSATRSGQPDFAICS
jgi:hypothetical protein